MPLRYEDFERAVERITKEAGAFGVYVSPDFQCDQTGGFPVSLCVPWEHAKAWLEPNESLVEDGEDISSVRQECADFGIRKCADRDNFNSLKALGKDAYQTAYLPSDEEIEEMEMNL